MLHRLNGRLFLRFPEQKTSQRDRIVMNFVVSGKYERDRLLPRERAQLAELIGALLQFPRVATAKLRSAGGIVPEPLAQLGTGREILGPSVYRRVRLLHATRP